MSDTSRVFIRLDVPSDVERKMIASTIREWLLNAEVIVPFAPKPTWRQEFGRTDFSPGPRWRDAVDEVPGAAFELLWHNGVDIRADVDHRSAMAYSEPWSCRRCAVESDNQELLSQWVDTLVEPTEQCESCGWQALLGDWSCEFPAVLVGAPIVEFHNWHPLNRDFVLDLLRKLGGDRSKSFLSHL